MLWMLILFWTKTNASFPHFIKVTEINSREFHSSTVNILNGNYLENQMFLHGLSYISSVCLKSIFFNCTFKIFVDQNTINRIKKI